MARFYLLAVILIAGGAGCTALFPDSAKTQHRLPPLVGPRNAIEIEVYFVDRRKGDPMIGDRLWSSLHSVHTLDPDSARQLEDDGFRVAMSASRPPRPLAVLMSLSDENDPTRRVVMQRYTIPAGQETLVVASEIPDGTVIQRPGQDSSRPLEMRLGRAIFRIQADKVEDGWTRLVVIPEIQHGPMAARPTPREQDWIYQESQQRVTLYSDRITAELNEQEILALGLGSREEGDIGQHFFVADSENGLERLILIRISGMSRIEPVRSDLADNLK
ncbi:hypothetical protein KOR42_34970 [Thalassoglobus neptunius]|uniref:Uncharacterized protein n=1 Tax=Thalassoglobus neptunius TaxID=1938619 RepID=A0A5C5WNE7_9PLAN|nr:hypothetical protein [Thalassoglobus neptunius]TWT51609.1 hypothetical protein KOR42_34970 [Thalassoglobus neptunius]